MKIDSFNLFVTPPAVSGGILLEVRRFSAVDSKELYLDLRKDVDRSEQSTGVSVSKYISKVIHRLVLNKHVIAKLLSTIGSKEIESKILWSIYDDLVELYPEFSLKNVLLNTVVFGDNSDTDQDFKDMLESLFREADDSLDLEEGNQNRRRKSSKMVPPRKKISLVTKEDIERLERYLKKNLIGQNTAIEEVIKQLKVVASGLGKRASFFFLGPTGVGKTQLSKLVGEKYGAGIIKINCGEYSKSHEYAKLIGSPPGYIGHTDTSFLGEKAKRSSRWVFIFDEIEKADDKLFDVLLNVLDEGTIDDSSGKTLDFKDSLFFFTSNNALSDRVGKTLVGFGDSGHKVSYEEVKEDLKDDLKKRFKPEFLNRIDDIVLFSSLSKEDVSKIAKIQLKSYPVKVTKSLLDKIVEDSYSEEYGARNVTRYIKSKLAPEVADCILDKEIPKKGSYYLVDFIVGRFKIVDTEKYSDGLIKEVAETIRSRSPKGRSSRRKNK